ncbi:polysaccharide deacetylase family protein [Candidatus Arthromitus sp. SFB-turkey]|uniref:polysaccharide deacetylase family protein n=1 Tax=Candidatus Arthromitus sp. SFB-turkey TaxID=1840217 RepID=UPI0007F54851|nr:polysaccharide deacetylase family protein [Candidatus Arthromitus sp. SFB-turkey]OAT87970.1 polysaccharide deacetylase [Candidatus Arthromitus sp. SFB-turkey]
MFDKLKCLFSFNWFYIVLFLVLSIFSFGDEITVGRETIKMIIKDKQDFSQKSQYVNSKNNKFNFIDIDKISSNDDMVIYTGEIEYIFFHPLILDSQNGFDIRKNNNRKLYNLFITTDEFKKCLEKLYENDYMLVDIFDVYKEVYKEGKFKIQRQDLKIPKGKKPFILFVDDLSYNRYMLNSTSSKLVLDESDFKIKSLNVEDGKEVLSDDKEIIPILNKFIEEHEDFSLNNAKGVISLTGSEGVFGYNTGKYARRNEKNVETLRRLSKDIFDAKKVADKLKEDGWKFACHTYDHINFKNVTMDYIKNDIENWFKYVSNIVGTTNIFVYPYDNSINEGDERFKYLNSNGFNIFCSSDKGINRDSFTLKDHVNIHRDLICYETIKSNKKNFYKIFEDVINKDTRKIKKKI